MAPRQTLVIGVGHPDRGDDAVGRVIAERLAGRTPDGVTVIDTDGDAGRLLDLFEGADNVVIVDAAVSGSVPGTIRRIDAAAGALPPVFAMSTHAIGLADAVELARTLDRLPTRCIVYAVEGASFDLGQPLSPEVAAAVDDVVARVLDEFGAEVT